MKVTNSELREISVKMEQDVQKFYIDLAGHISDPMVKNYLLLMAKDEAHHEHEFEFLLGEKGGRQYGWENSDALRELIDTRIKQDLFPRLDSILANLPHFEGVQVALEFALQCEELAVEFYGLLRECCEDAETKARLIPLESEEKSHRDYIQALIEYWQEESE